MAYYLDQEFAKPVVTNTQAWGWHALRTLGIDSPISGFGALLKTNRLV